MNIKEKRRNYEKPAMQVFELKQQPQLLAGSGLTDPTDYTPGTDPFGGA